MGKLDDLLARKPSLYLTGLEKDDLVDEGTTFILAHVSRGSGSFGDRWEASIILNGAERIITLPLNDARDEVMAGLAELCDQEGPQGPLRMVSAKLKGGHRFYRFESATADAAQQTEIPFERGTR